MKPKKVLGLVLASVAGKTLQDALTVSFAKGLTNKQAKMILRDMVYERLEKNRSSCKHHHPEGEPCAIDIINGTNNVADMLLVIADKIRINESLETTPEVMELPLASVTNVAGQEFTVSVVVRKGSTPPCVLADDQSKSVEDFKEVMEDYGIVFGDREEEKPTASTEQKDEVLDNVENHLQATELISYTQVGCKYTLEEFKAAVEEGSITDDDGQGYWGTGLGYSHIDCFDEKPEWATHVAWFNK